MRNMKLIKVAYHRNGVAGEGFHVVAFRFRHDGKYRRMVATLFSTAEPELGEVHPCNGRLAVLDADCAAAGVIERPDNQWRGDDFEPQLRQWIAQWDVDRERRVAALAPVTDPAEANAA